MLSHRILAPILALLVTLSACGNGAGVGSSTQADGSAASSSQADASGATSFVFVPSSGGSGSATGQSSSGGASQSGAATSAVGLSSSEGDTSKEPFVFVTPQDTGASSSAGTTGETAGGQGQESGGNGAGTGTSGEASPSQGQTGAASPADGQQISQPSGDVTPSADASASPSSQVLAGHIICVDPGHCVVGKEYLKQKEQVSPLSTETKNAFGGGTEGSTMTEEQLTLIMGFKLRDALQDLGAQVVMTREVHEIPLTNKDRCDIAYDSGSDVCVRIHANGFSDPSAHGVSVQVPSGDLLGTPSIVGESTRLGQLMVDAVAAETGAKNRGIAKRDDLTGFNWAKIPTVLIEMGFMTNPEEDRLMMQEDYQDKIVRGMVNSLCDWYGVEAPDT